MDEKRKERNDKCTQIFRRETSRINKDLYILKTNIEDK